MNTTLIILLLFPVILLIALFIGVVKKNKRVWVTSLILLAILSVSFVVVNTFTTTMQKTATTESQAK